MKCAKTKCCSRTLYRIWICMHRFNSSLLKSIFSQIDRFVQQKNFFMIKVEFVYSFFSLPSCCYAAYYLLLVIIDCKRVCLAKLVSTIYTYVSAFAVQFSIINFFFIFFSVSQFCDSSSNCCRYGEVFFYCFIYKYFSMIYALFRIDFYYQIDCIQLRELRYIMQWKFSIVSTSSKLC